MTIEKDVAHPTRGRYDAFSNIFWVRATEGERITHFAVCGEMLLDQAYLEYEAKRYIAMPAEAEAKRDREYLAAKEYFANLDLEKFGKVADIVIERMKAKGTL